MKIEVALHAELDRPFLERLPEGVGRIHAGMNHHSSHILGVLEPLLLEGESEFVSRLMSDDDFPREFGQMPNFLLIRSAENYL